MNAKYSLSEFAEQIATRTGGNKQATDNFAKTLFSLLEETLLQDKIVKIKGIGTFKLQMVEKRRSVNINTGNAVEIPAHYKVVFQPEKELNEQVNGILAAFESVEIEHDTLPELLASTEQPEEETKNDDTPFTLPPPKNNKSEEKIHKNTTWFKRLIWGALALSAVLAAIIYIDISESAEQKLPTVETPTIETPTIAPPATATTEEKTTTHTTPPQAEPTPPTTPKATQTDIANTDVVGGGEHLSVLAMRHYGHKAFWVYIYDENRDKIPSPHKVFAGMKVVIPPRSKYNIDASNPQSVAKAKARAEEIQKTDE